jgi:N-acetylneuraminic acid mutarotase
MQMSSYRRAAFHRPRWIAVPLAVATLAALVGGLGVTRARTAEAADVVAFRVNAGGPSLAGSPAWSADTSGAPSPLVNASLTGNTTFSTTTAIDTSHPSIPAGTPSQVFQTERWDGPAAPEMEWNFPVTTGKRYEVRLYFAEIYSGAQAVGARVFDVVVDGTLVLDNYDVFAKVGANKGVVERVQITSDTNIDVDFVHVVENPAIKAIEIVELGAAAGQLGATPSSLGFGQVVVGATQSQTLELVNLGDIGDPSITVTGTTITGPDASMFADSFDDGAGVTLTPGSTTAFTVTFTPASTGVKSASLSVTHSGGNSPMSIPLTGEGVSSQPIAFSKSSLAGETSSQPTSLQFGPDGKLYVAQQNGVIKVYGVARNGKDSYAVTSTQTITSIQSMPNRNDDGTINPGVTDRQVTGLLVTGTAANPVIYVGSSDPRIGGGSSGTETGLDTNSGIISKLTWNGSSWQKIDLVRGLPRSEENHSINGLQLDPATNTLYAAQGGNTNMGAPSNNFAKLPEYALSAAILSVDLNAIGNNTYDLPTLDDSARTGANDANDPFGGNNGNNQAKLIPGGPVQVFHAGFRNPYDLLITESGRYYTIDNGANAGWGGVPVNEGPQGTCTNAISEPGTTDVDTFHLVKLNGYGGHPNPTRGNMANTFSSPPQSPVSVANPIECDWRAAGPERGNITAYQASTNGLTEYTASNFDGQLKGDILSASFDNKIYRAKLNSTGTQLVSGGALFQNVGNTPLDVVAQGDGSVFPGTIWVADIGNGNITVFEPGDFGGGGGGTCAGTYSTTLDEDGDGFKNADEIDNGTNPCSSADVPPDRDGDKTSDLNDPDDDNDALPDTSDPFAIDPNNGKTTTTPLQLTWDNDAPPAGGLVNLGFTGLMTNGTSNYASLYDPSKMTAGGAAGVTTVDQVSEGDAYASLNTQEYGFQVGLTPPAGSFAAHTRILGPFKGLVPQDFQSMGLFIGTGHQDHYAKLVVSANGGAGGIEFLKEVGGVPTHRPQAPVALPGPDAIDLYLTVDPAAGTVQPSFTVTTAGTTGPRTTVGGPEPIPASWLSGTSALAAGIISTSNGAAPPFPATWDFFEVVPDAAPSKSLLASPNSLAFESAQGGASRSANVALTASDSAGATYSVTDNAAWVTVTPTSGTTPSSVMVTVNPAGLAPGTYQAVVTATSSGYSPVEVPVTLSVTASSSPYSLVLSANERRSNPQPLDGKTVSGGIYVSTTPDTGVRQVRFFIDNVGATGTPFSTDTQSPYDLAGGNRAKARPFDTRTLSDGPHTVTAAVDLTAGGTQLTHATITVANTTTTAWSSATPMPVALGEVASGLIAGKLYVVGEGSPVTLAYDTTARTWTSTGLATRPFPGNHHVAEVVGGKLYLFGGLGGGSEGKVQIYDPTTNQWTQGAPMPFAAGSSSSAVIGDHVYVSGGIVGSSTTAQAARYTPATNTWVNIAPMPQGRNHAAAESDGSKMFVFGGRGPGSGDGNVVANGFDTVQIYDPVTNTWVSSLDSGSTLKPLPQARGGMGTAVFTNGEFWVMGGETSTGAGATTDGVYNRVDVYNPTTNTWRSGPPMPTARHGIYPVLNGTQIHVAGGGVKSGFSSSTVHEVLKPV